MIKSDYLLVRDRIHQNDSIESIIDINNNYYKRYENLLSTNPISYKINIIDPARQYIFHPVNRYISSTMLEYNLKNLTVVLTKPLIIHIEYSKPIGIIATRLRRNSYLTPKTLYLPLSKVNFFRIKYKYLKYDN